MALGKTVIASAIGGIPEIVEHGKTGLLFPTGDSKTLSRILQELTREARTEIGGAARKRINTHSSDEFYGRLMRLYNRVHRKTRT